MNRDNRGRFIKTDNQWLKTNGLILEAERPRDAQGRFVKNPDLFKTIPAQDYYRSNPVPNPFADYSDDETPIKIGRGVRLAVWLSHNRVKATLYTLYLGLCLLAGAIGGYYGVVIGLKH